jgi:hypothetical protein
MHRTSAYERLAASLLLLALPATLTGCANGGGWGWSPMAMNPFRSSTESQVASRPSGQIATPSATGLAGSNSGTHRSHSGTNEFAAPTYSANNQARPSGGFSANTNDYNTRQASATQDGYPVGNYATGGANPAGTGSSGYAQNGPYSPKANTTANPYATDNSAYGGNNPYAAQPGGYPVTADRRSEAGFGAGYSNPTPYSNPTGNYTPPAATSTPSYSAPGDSGYQGGYPTTGGADFGTAPSQSPYVGATGVSSPAAPASSSGTSGSSEGGYRPGSTGRASSVSPVSYDNASDGFDWSDDNNSPAASGSGSAPSYSSDFPG